MIDLGGLAVEGIITRRRTRGIGHLMLPGAFYTRQRADRNTMQIKVECYAGYRSEETPRYLRIGGQRLAVLKIVDRWLAPCHRYFKLQTADESTWIIRHDTVRNTWELTFFKRA